jgi:redox-sensitive bicupin YhaK (pirin superfamily)
VRGVQTWVALPAESRHIEPGFAHHGDLPRVGLTAASGPDLAAVVFLGTFAGATSSARCYSPLVGVELTATGATEAVVPLDPTFEYGILTLDDPMSVDGVALNPGDLRYLGWGGGSLNLRTSGPAKALLLGGEPLTEELLMWWNFVGRSHEDIAAARADWQSGAARFGPVVGDPAERLLAPILPNARLRPRRGRPAT